MTGDECSQTGIHWTYDTYALSQGTTKAVSKLGVKSWFFLSADYSLGARLEADSRKVIDAEGGRVVGSVEPSINAPRFSSFLLQAQSLVPGQPGGAELDQLVLLEVRPRRRHHVRLHGLARVRVGYADDRHLGDARVGAERLLHLCRDRR